MNRPSTRTFALLACGLAALVFTVPGFAHEAGAGHEVIAEAGELVIPVDIDPCEPISTEQLRSYVTAMVEMGFGPIRTDEIPVDDTGDPLPGYEGQIPFPTPTECDTQIWDDSDGVDPATAGCHYEYHDQDEDKCSNRTGAVFGEACMGNDLLVETNPEKNKCHTHAGGIGHPDTFQCSAYCLGTTGEVGYCEVVPDFCESGVDSAFCNCGTCPAFEQGGETTVSCDVEVCCLYEDGTLSPETAGSCFVNGGEGHVDFEDCF